MEAVQCADTAVRAPARLALLLGSLVLGRGFRAAVPLGFWPVRSGLRRPEVFGLAGVRAFSGRGAAVDAQVPVEVGGEEVETVGM